MKKIRFLLIGSGIALMSLFPATACEKNVNTGKNAEVLATKSLLISYFEEDKLPCNNLPSDFQEATDEELTMLNHMKEEEKLARDVYNVLSEKWGIPIFTNIAKSEQRHLSAIIGLIRLFSPTDTVVAEAGVFSLPELQSLYNDLIAKGTTSLQDGLLVGATIEDLDIKDLSDYLEKTDNDYIEFVFNNLERGSFNHMRAFSAHLNNWGIEYDPQFISRDLYDSIIKKDD